MCPTTGSDVMDTTAPVTLCIVNYNGARYLSHALQAAQQQSRGFAEILLVDNASTDDSLQIIATHFPQVRILPLERNQGPGAARNAGFAAAACDLILFQDNDVRLEPDCVAGLCSVLDEQPRALLVAPRVLYGNAPEIIQYDSADCHFLGLMALRNANCKVADADCVSRPTTSLVTACFLMDRRRWNGSLPFDEDFVFNLEDHDFGVRANLQGLQTWIEPRARVRHGEGTAGLSYRPGQTVASQRMFYLIRNRWLIIGKSFSLRTIILLSPVLLLYELFQLAGLIGKGWSREWWRAVRSFWGELPRLRYKRALVQASRIAPDRRVLRPGPLPFTVAIRSSLVEKIAVLVLQWIANGYWWLARAFV